MLKLVVNNKFISKDFDDYKKAVEFLCEAVPHRFKNINVISEEGAVRLMNRLCSDYIDITERDNGTCLYKIRIKN